MVWDQVVLVTRYALFWATTFQQLGHTHSLRHSTNERYDGLETKLGRETLTATCRGSLSWTIFLEQPPQPWLHVRRCLQDSTPGELSIINRSPATSTQRNVQRLGTTGIAVEALVLEHLAAMRSRHQGWDALAYSKSFGDSR